MSLTSGFYNALSGDRQYDARDMSGLFNSLILDGVFASIGSAFIVEADTGNTVTVGIGRAWFDSTWTYNDSIMPIEAPLSEILLDRIDAVVLEMNSTESVRANSIKIIKGTPATVPVNPEMEHSVNVHQYPLCYILRPAGSYEIRQIDITNAVGTSECPFVTGILDTVDTDDLILQWSAEWRTWINQNTDDWDAWVATNSNDFYIWFEGLKDVLDENTAATLYAMIDTHINNGDVHTTLEQKNIWDTTSAVVTANQAIWSAKATTATYLVTIPTTWSATAPFTITVSTPGITSVDNPLIDVILSANAATAKLQLEAWGLVSQVTTNNGSITATCLEKKPVTAIPIQLKVVR